MENTEASNGIRLSRTAMAVLAAIFFGLTFAAFGTSVWHGFSMIDDPYLVYGNLAIRGPTLAHLQRAFTSFDPELYIPFTLLSYQLNYLIGGLNSGIYHLTNLLLHALNGCLIALIIALITRRRSAALFAGFLWLVHPINAEAVVWIAGRKDLLSTFFVLLSIVGYLRYREKENWIVYALSIAAFAAALLSKASVATLPAILLILDLLLSQKLRIKNILDKIPYAALSALFIWIATLGKVRVIHSSSLSETFLMACKSTVFYLEKLLIPINLTPLYPYQKPILLSSPDFFIPLTILIILAVAIITSLKRTRWIALTSLMFLILLSPTYFNFHKGDEIFFAVDRYVYLPSIGLFLLLAVAVSRIEILVYDRIEKLPAKRILSGAGLAVIALFAALSIYQTNTWSSDKALFDHALALYPDSVPARISLSVVYRETGQLDAEKRVLEEGLAQHPTVEYYTALGSVAAREGDLAKAEQLYNQGLALDPKNPESFFYLGSLEEQRGNVEKAIEDYQKAVALDDSYIAAAINLGGIYQESGKLAEAEKLFIQAIAWNPNSMEAQYNLFQVLEFEKRPDEAFPHLALAYELNPDEHDIALAYAYRLITRKQTEEARAVLHRMLLQNPDDTAAQRMLDQISDASTTSSDAAADAKARAELRKQQREQTQ